MKNVELSFARLQSSVMQLATGSAALDNLNTSRHWQVVAKVYSKYPEICQRTSQA